MGFPVLETERLRLIEISEADAPQYFEIMSNDEVTRYYGMDSLRRMEEAHKLIESFRYTFEGKRGIRWGIRLKETEAFAGTIGLNNLNLKSKKAEVGYELHPVFWGQGITGEALQAVLNYAFTQLGLFRIGAVTFPQNPSSIRVLKKAGFREEGRLRGYLYQDGRSHDALVFSLLQPEWKAAREKVK